MQQRVTNLIACFKTTASLLRVSHWVKSTALFVPIFYFANNLPKVSSLICAFVAFSLASSSGYIVNDYKDRLSDAKHPVKRKRIIATGSLSLFRLKVFFLISFISSLALSFSIGEEFFKIVCGYSILSFSYSFFLKKRSASRLFILPFFFILRLFAGAALISNQVTSWFFVLAYLVLAGLAFLKSKIDAIDFTLTSLEWQRYQSWSLVTVFELTSYVTLIFAVSVPFYRDLASNEILRNPELIFVSVLQVLIIYFLIDYYAVRKRSSLEPIIFCLTNPVIVFLLFVALITSWKTRF